MKKADEILQHGLFAEQREDASPGQEHKDLKLSKRAQRRLSAVETVRLLRDIREQQVCYSSRPFVLTGLPIRKLKPHVREYQRKNGHFTLSIIGHPDKGIPFGQDRLIPIWMATLARRQNERTVRFDAASDFLNLFGVGKGGTEYKRLVQGFERIFYATIVFGTDRTQGSPILAKERFNFFKSFRLWYTKDGQPIPGQQNVIELSQEFYEEIQQHKIPIDLAVVRALANCPGNLDFYTWLVWRCYTAVVEVEIPLHGPIGLIHQLGVSEKTTPKEFTRRIKDWLNVTRTLWPECPAQMKDADTLIVAPGPAAIGKRQEGVEWDGTTFAPRDGNPV